MFEEGIKHLRKTKEVKNSDILYFWDEDMTREFSQEKVIQSETFSSDVYFGIICGYNKIKVGSNEALCVVDYFDGDDLEVTNYLTDHVTNNHVLRNIEKFMDGAKNVVVYRAYGDENKSRSVYYGMVVEDFF